MKQPQSIQINIPQPCQEDWSKMTPQEHGRFCDSCRKCVVDFTNATDEEIYKYISEHSNQKICGKFQKWQVNRAISLPPKPKNRFYKWFISLGFILFISKLFSADSKAYTPPKTHLSPSKKGMGNLLGTVYDSDHTPLMNAKVTAYLGDVVLGTTTTDKHGEYLIKNIDTGNIIVVINYEDYQSYVMKNVAIESNMHTEVNATLNSSLKQLNKIDTAQYVPPTMDLYGMVEIQVD